jgi:hypothetical protein
MAHSTRTIWSMFGLWLTLAACSDSPQARSAGVGDAGDGGASAQDASADAGPMCGATRCQGDAYCGAAGYCVGSGKCGDAQDCQQGERCASASKTCQPLGACELDDDCGAGQECNAAKQCVIGGGCGQNELSGQRVAPNLMILLDRSGSMDDDADGDTRWNVAKKAIAAVTGRFGDEIRFGLATYSSCQPGGCSAGSIVVPIAGDDAGRIDAFLSNKVDQGSQDGAALNDDGDVQYLCDSDEPETSTGKSLFALVNESSLQDPARENAVLLITDGEESDECIDDEHDGKAGAAALLAQAIRVRTYVVGLGVNADSVDEIAVAGGTSQLLPADNEAELTAALARIASQALSCELVLDNQPNNPDEIYVFFNDEPTQIARDDADGWFYEPATRTITFQGASCGALKEQRVSDVDVVFGCPAPVLQ